MIVSENVKISVKKPLDNADIENELFSKGINVMRWAIVGIDENMITINISYVKKF